MTELGSGIALDEQYDLFVDGRTGDLASESEEDELGKDLAFNVARYLTQADVLGEVISAGLREDIKINIRKVLLADDRVERVASLQLSIPDNRNQTLTVKIDVIPVSGDVVEEVITV